MPTDQPSNEPTSAPPADDAAPGRTIEIIEEITPPRPYKTAPTLISDEELAALAAQRMAESDRKATPATLTDGQVEIRAEGDRIIARRVGDPTPANAPLPAPAPMTARALSKREAEMEAGRRAVARAEQERAYRPPLVKSAAEIAAEGTNTPVFRPGDFREYANMRAGTASKDSGSSMLNRVARTLPEA